MKGLAKIVVADQLVTALEGGVAQACGAATSMKIAKQWSSYQVGKRRLNR